MAQSDVAGPLTQRADYSLFVVTARDGAELSGCLAGFVTQCSIEPVRFLVCASRANHTFGVLRRAGSAGLHLLGAGQHDLAALFGEATGDEVDKFARCRWTTGSTGAPILDACAAWVEGPIDGRFDAGDHEAMLLVPVAGGAGPCPGTLTYRQARDLEAGHPPDDA